MRASFLILSAALVLAGCQSPKLTGEEAKLALEACVFADELTKMDSQVRGDGPFTPMMIENLNSAASVCSRVKDIDRSAVSPSAQPCLQVYVYKAEIYRYAKPVLVERDATPTEIRKMEDLLAKMQGAIHRCENPAQTLVA